MSLIGREVVFSVNREESDTGKVIDKVMIRDEKSPVKTVTGYMIETEEGRLYNDIAYWRIKSIVNSQSN